jgi:hypothetical protein
MNIVRNLYSITKNQAAIRDGPLQGLPVALPLRRTRGNQFNVHCQFAVLDLQQRRSDHAWRAHAVGLNRSPKRKLRH